jgi:2-succinyl-5-enolpyruvyl-6-hydroxy-3-cyclohexene-1-carboxylate synthase
VALQKSVPSPSDVQATFAATLFDQWIRSGLRDVVIGPGSRSTPLALAAAERDELDLHVRIDERSAAFFAIGRALATAKPVAIIVTSGTAAAELHAAVCEADKANVPLLVLSADRPAELHGVGAPQTIDQRHLYGRAVRLFEEPGVAREDASLSWRPLAGRLWTAAMGGIKSAGPVHLNAAFAEPLIGTSQELPPARDIDAPWRTSLTPGVGTATLDVNGSRVLCVVGAGVNEAVIGVCRDLDWVVLGDATAQGTLAYFDPLLRDDEFAAAHRPDLVVRMGGLPASKVLATRLREWNVRVIALLGVGDVADPDGLVSESLPGLPSRDVVALRAEPAYVTSWNAASQTVEEYLRSVESDDEPLDEPAVARLVVELSGDNNTPLVVGSSMPVRDVEWWASARRARTYSNRGVNGIDGVVSTVLGVCAGGKGIGLVGDLTMLHDVSGLVDGLGATGGTCVLVVNDNGGGGIFSFLPQAGALANERFEQLFGTPRLHDLELIARSFGHAASTVWTRGELRTAVEKALGEPGISVVVAKVPARERNVEVHDELEEALKRWRALCGE